MSDRLDRSVNTQVAISGVKIKSEVNILRQAVKEAAMAATDFDWLASGDSVLIKPVLNSGNPYPGTTHRKHAQPFCRIQIGWPQRSTPC